MQYNFPMTLDRQFKNKLEKLHNKYGTNMMEIEGMSPKQLDTCDFYAHFLKIDTVADATTDANANVTDKNINTMQKEAKKPFTRLLSRNKLYIELKEEFGKEVADNYLESVVNGELYEHDNYDSSYKPYSYFGDETILVKYKKELQYISFKGLFNLVEEKPKLIHKEDKAYAKYTDDLMIWDNGKWTKVIRVIKKPRQTDYCFIKGSNGLSQIVTTNHPIITNEGDINAENVVEKEHLIKTSLPDISFGGKRVIYPLELLKDEKGVLFNGEEVTKDLDLTSYGQVSFYNKQSCLLNKIKLDEDFGWLYGMLLSEGHLECSGLGISQNKGKIFDNIIRILVEKNIPFSVKEKDNGCYLITIKSKMLKKIFEKEFDFVNTSREKRLPYDFLKYNKEFLKSVVGGVLDGDGTLELKSNRRLLIRTISRELLNQLSFIVQLCGYNVRDGKPTPPKDTGMSYTPKHTMYKIAFTPYRDGEKFNSVKIKENVKEFSTKEEGQKHSNSRYSFGYGDVNVINNNQLSLKEEEYVYDISTKTETFICNNIKSHNCYAFSLQNIVEKGLYFLDEMAAGRPKHWDTFNHHTLEFISYASNMQSGAVGIPDYLVYAYYFYQKDIKDKGMNKKQAEYYRNQKFQEFVYNLNQPYLKGGVQSAYTNVSILDREHISNFFGDRKYPNGDMIIEHMDEIIKFQKNFLDYVGKLRKNKWHTFPVISATLVFRNNEFQDKEVAKAVVKHNWKYGFNDINIMRVENATSVASCCRLVNDKEQMQEGRVFNSIGGSELDLGSTKVVTLNLVRLALLSKGNKNKFINLVENKVKLIHKYHFAHRRTLKKLIDKGMLPLYSSDMMSMDNQFATVGINGVFEAMKILDGINEDNSYNESGFKIAEDIFKVINKLNKTTAEKYGYVANIEQVPAESAAIKLNKKDRLFFGNRKINNKLGEDCYIYGNQWIPLKEQADLFDRVEAAKLDEYCGGGAILHINLGENFNTFEDAWEFTNNLMKKGVKYFSYISLIDICPNDHSFFGNKCPICGKKSKTKGIKIVGYLVKQDSYKQERKDELKERKFYNL